MNASVKPDRRNTDDWDLLLGRAIALFQPVFTQYREKGFCSSEIAERLHEAVDFVAGNAPARTTKTANKTARTLSDPKDRARFKEAVEEYFSTGACSVTCDECGQPIRFQDLGSAAWEHSCACGKYTATLRGR